MCSGAIVSSRHVLTTASCVSSLSPAQVQASVGSVSYYSGEPLCGKYYRASSSLNNNIAILTVETPFDFRNTTVKPIPLAAVAPATDSSVTVTAYGAVDTSLDLPDVLQKANLRAFSREFCEKEKKKKRTN